MTTLQGEDKEADDLFWNQDAFKEEDEADKDYVFKKQGDIIDSDFDISEAEEEAAPVEDERRGSTKRKSTYADPVLRAQKRRARALLKRQGGGAPAKRKPHRGPAGPLPPSSMSRRHSTKAKSARTTEAQSAHAIAAKARGVKRAARLSKSAPEKTTWTQEEMLLAAVDTEWENLTAARRIMRKRKAARGAVAPARRDAGGTRVKWTSKLGAPTTLSWSGAPSAAGATLWGAAADVDGGDEEEEEGERGSHGVRPRRARRDPTQTMRCAVSGAPARYFDPLTREPYADLAAFRELRRRHAEGERGSGSSGRSSAASSVRASPEPMELEADADADADAAGPRPSAAATTNGAIAAAAFAAAGVPRSPTGAPAASSSAAASLGASPRFGSPGKAAAPPLKQQRPAGASPTPLQSPTRGAGAVRDRRHASCMLYRLTIHPEGTYVCDACESYLNPNVELASREPVSRLSTETAFSTRGVYRCGRHDYDLCPRCVHAEL